MAIDILERFYRAWNERDAAGVAHLLGKTGTFVDPHCGAPLSGDALKAHADKLFAALPTLRFSVDRTLRQGDEDAIVEWTLTGVCKGSLDDQLVAEGVDFRIAGIDVFELAGGQMVSVRRLFDRRELADALRLLTIVEPIGDENTSFGYSMRIWVSKAKPGLLAMTWIAARSESEKAAIRKYARGIVKDFQAIPGFIGIVTGFAGLHGFTMTAWESEEALRAGVHGPEHVEAMRAFHAGATGGVFTSVWQPLRLNRLWTRCAHCGKANDGLRPSGRCEQCGTPLPEHAPYV